MAKKSATPVEEPKSTYGLVLAAVVAMVAVIGLVILISGEKDRATGQSFNSYSVPHNECTSICPTGFVGKPVGHKAGADTAHYCFCMKPT